MQLSAGYLWIKALHIAFMVTWFAGLFYLPRLFIYHSEAGEEIAQTRFGIMERRLFIIMTIGAVLTTVFGIALLSINPVLLNIAWFRLKLILLAGLFIYHLQCWHWIGRLKAGRFPDNTKGLRWFNEIPTIFLLAIVILAIVKPF